MTFPKPLLLLSFLPLLLLGCKTEKQADTQNEYLRWVGDIEHNETTDEPDFKICNGDEQILQYFNLGAGPIFPEEKSTLVETFESKYEPVKTNDQNGFIRIRFVVNCEGKASRFRILQADKDYNEIEFDERITNQLLEITKGIESWKVMYRHEIPVDYYFYLIFKIKNGRITEILP
ncbi:hypothetical protein [Salinimicrobium flavum]|uniref:TonB protein C-terminal n=1 Tax=Salinimicrobium flavum TaxID=1737065 RepID=A0ABW5IX98_9FLAO